MKPNVKIACGVICVQGQKGSHLEQLGPGVVEQARVRPQAVAGVRRPKVLQAAQDVRGGGVQQRRPRVVF